LHWHKSQAITCYCSCIWAAQLITAVLDLGVSFSHWCFEIMQPAIRECARQLLSFHKTDSACSIITDPLTGWPSGFKAVNQFHNTVHLH